MSTSSGPGPDPGAAGQDRPGGELPAEPARAPDALAPEGSDPQHGPAGRRPPQVLSAAVLGFVVAFFLLLNAVVAFAVTRALGPLAAVIGVVYLGLTALNVVGAVQAVQGRSSVLLKTAGTVTVLLGVLSLVAALAQGRFDLSALFSVAVGVGIVVLLVQPAAKRWFGAR
ncbi:hypothetical protein DQ238_05385 [Geodermatophilus sp. TF02-6]|uniref:hypothetical protein n=1 Tax=Geodermatophilus sp. TF02-6 TaxID=2250575 RepID=UPI000DEBFE2C|nr:hypothetical protein [Geodermatophilus sp. TF02-6]RBY82044.1 hypothetical protein DQ238_05385 [Geodermatophilus sp. TF02-6]